MEGNETIKQEFKDFLEEKCKNLPDMQVVEALKQFLNLKVNFFIRIC